MEIDKLQRMVRGKFQVLMDSRQREYERLPAVQGVSNDVGNAGVPGMTGWVYVRIGNNESVARAFNNRTSHRNGLPVYVGYLPEQPTLFQVIAERQLYFNEAAGGQSTGPHGDQHVWPNEDSAYIRYRQLGDCRIYITDPASLSVGVADGYYFITDEIYYYDGATVDLTSYVPGSGRVWILLELTASGLSISSHPVASHTLASIPKATDKSYWRIAAVALTAGQTEITDYPNDQHIFDLRQSRIAGSEYAEHGQLPGLEDDDHTQYAVSPEKVILVHESPGMERTGEAYNTIEAALNIASAGDTIVIVGTFTEDVVISTSGISLVGLNPEQSVIEGEVTVSVSAQLRNLKIVADETKAGTVYGIDCNLPGAGTVMIRNVYVDVNNDDASNDAVGVRANDEATVWVMDSHIYSTVTGSGDAYALVSSAGAVLYALGCYCSADDYDLAVALATLQVGYCQYDTGKVYGTPTYMDSYEILTSLKTVDGAGSGLDADKTDGYEAPATPAASSIVVLDASGNLKLPGAGDVFYGDDAEASLGYRIDFFQSPVTDHFDTGSLGGSWSWAGAPFSTPGSVVFTTPSVMRVLQLGAAANRAFLYQSVAGTPGNVSARAGIVANIDSLGVGTRMDDGSDNNYVEAIFQLQTGNPHSARPQLRYRTGGGSVTTVSGNTFSVPMSLFVVDLNVAGTQWTNWNAQTLMYGGIADIYYCGGAATGLTWTPTRVGLLFDQGGVGYATWHTYYVDFFKVV